MDDVTPDRAQELADQAMADLDRSRAQAEFERNPEGKTIPKPYPSANPNSKNVFYSEATKTAASVFKRLCRDSLAETFVVLSSIMNNPNEPAAVRLGAASYLTNRALGKLELDFMDLETATLVSRMPVDDALAYVLDQVACGKIAVQVGENFSKLIVQRYEVARASELEARLAELEKAIATVRDGPRAKTINVLPGLSPEPPANDVPPATVPEPPLMNFGAEAAE